MSASIRHTITATALTAAALSLAAIIAACSPAPGPDPTVAPTWTPVPTWTPAPTYTPMPTFTPTPTAIPAPSPTATAMPTATPAPSTTVVPQPTATPTSTPAATTTPKPSPTPSPAPTTSPTPTSIPINDATPPATPAATPIPSPSTEEQRQTLAEFYAATGGDNWTNNEGWLSDVPLRQWHGVSTDIRGNVTGLRLQDNNLSGRLPASIADLPKLTQIILPENRISGPIPAEIGQLASLVYLDLWDNQLTGIIPTELGNLKRLTSLGLARNELGGTIPTEIWELTRLNTLGLDGNNLTGEIPKVIGNLASLNWLDLSSNKLTGTIPRGIGTLKMLDVLGLAGNELTGSIPTEMENLRNLTWLSLSGNQLEGCIPKSLRRVGGNDLQGLALPFCGTSESAGSTEQFSIPSTEVLSSVLQVFSNSSFARAGSVSTGWIVQVNPDGSALALTAFNPFREARYDYLGARFQGEESWRAGEIVAYDAPRSITVFEICCNANWKPLTLSQSATLEAESSSFAFGIQQVYEDSPWFYDSRFAFSPLDPVESETAIASNIHRATSLTPSFAGGPVLNRSGEVVGMVTHRDSSDGNGHRILPRDQLNDFLIDLREGDGIVFTDITRPELPPNYKFVVGDGVSQADVHQLARATSNLHEYAVFAGIPVSDEPKTIYIEHDRNNLTKVFVTVEGWQEEDALKYWRGHSIPGGTASINLAYQLVDEPLPEGEHQYTPWIVDGHEIVHGMYQFGLGGLYTNRGWFRRHHAQSPPWMGEGLAMVYQQLAFCHANSVPYLHNPWDKAAALEWSGTLEDIDGLEPEEWGSVYKYSAGAEAIELLATIVGVSRLFDFYTVMRPNEPWQSTFRRAYGISVEEFYERFNQHKAAGLPDLELPIRVESGQE